jgi:hypothetical protein
MLSYIVLYMLNSDFTTIDPLNMFAVCFNLNVFMKYYNFVRVKIQVLTRCKEVRFASFHSGGFITDIVVNSPERNLTKRNSVQCLTPVCNSK